MIPGCKCDCHAFHHDSYAALAQEATTGRISAIAYPTEGEPEIPQVFVEGVVGPLAPRLIFVGAFHGNANLERRVFDVIAAAIGRRPEVTLRFHEVAP